MIKLFSPYVNHQARMNVMRVLSGKQIAQGPEVDLFEKEFAEKFGFEAWQIVTLNSGTSALELAYDLVGLKEGHEVITPVLTCTATNIPLVRRGCNIIFGDIDAPKSLNIDPGSVEDHIWPETKAVVFVHFGGSSYGLKKIEELCEEHNVDLVCDAAQALGDELSRKARFSCISLQAIKSLTAGDGGILICRDKEDAKKARKMRWFGYDRELKQKLGDCDLDLAGYKMHMNDISAAIARGNLEDWDKIFEHRRMINEIYFNAWKKRQTNETMLIPGIWNPQIITNFDVASDFLIQIAKDNGFEIGQYHYPNSKYSLFKKYCFIKNTPNMDIYEDRYFMLPCHMDMTVADAKLIAKTLWPKAI